MYRNLRTELRTELEGSERRGRILGNSAERGIGSGCVVTRLVRVVVR